MKSKTAKNIDKISSDESKLNYFLKKLFNLQCKLWHFEFLRFQLRNMREGFRVEYDRLQEVLDAAQKRLAAEKEKEDPDKTICANMEKTIERYTTDTEQLKKQMEGIDGQIEGLEDKPEATKTVNELIEDHQTAISILKDYIKKL